MGGRGPLLGSLRVRCLAVLIDRLGRRDGLFLEWAFTAFGDDERRRRGELPEDNSSSVDKSISYGVAPLCLCQDGEGERGEEALVTARPGWLPAELAGARFHLVIDSSVRGVHPSVLPAPLVLLPVLDAKGGTDLRGPGSQDC